CRKPISPEARICCTAVSRTLWLLSTRRTNGFGASSGVFSACAVSGMWAAPVESSVDDVHLLFARQTHEIDCVAGDANGQMRIFFWMLHCIQQHVAIQHVHVHV